MDILSTVKKILFKRGTTDARPTLEDGEIYLNSDKKAIDVQFGDELITLINESNYYSKTQVDSLISGFVNYINAKSPIVWIGNMSSNAIDGISVSNVITNGINVEFEPTSYTGTNGWYLIYLGNIDSSKVAFSFELEQPYYLTSSNLLNHSISMGFDRAGSFIELRIRDINGNGINEWIGKLKIEIYQ